MGGCLSCLPARRASKDIWALYDHVEGPQPGTADFKPTKEWLTGKLRVPIKSCVATEKAGGGDAGMSGCKYFNVKVEYAGPVTNPTFGLPTDLFVKLRQPGQPLSEFAPEMVVGYLARHLADPPPMARVLWAGPHSVISEGLSTQISARKWKNKGDDGDQVSVEHAKQILKAYAHLHASFWGLEHVPGLLTLKEWWCIFTGGFPNNYEWPKEYVDRSYELFGKHAGLLEKMRDEIGIDKIFEHICREDRTLCQGDAHNGQVLKIKKHSGFAEEHGRWSLIDFGAAVVANPAIDIGAFMIGVDVQSEAEWVECLDTYWEELTTKLGDVKPKMTRDQFHLYACIGSLYRFIFCFTFMYGELSGGKPVPEEDKKAIIEIMNLYCPVQQSEYDALVEDMKKCRKGSFEGCAPAA